MNCKHKPASYWQVLMEGDKDMVCRHCNKPIRTKDPRKAGIMRKVMALVPMAIFLVIIGTDISESMSKAGMVYTFLACTGATIIGWLILCRFVWEYELVPEENASDDENS